VQGFSHQGHRCQGTATDTGHPLDAELAVLGGLPFLDLQFALEILQDDLAAPTWQAVPMQTFTGFFPGGLKRNWL
jgi:hypothetical protein